MPVRQLLVYKIDKYEFAVDISEVEQIITPEGIFQLPGVPPFIKGVMNVRGDICTIIDIRKILDTPEREADEDTRIIVTKLNGQLIGILADKADEIVSAETGFSEIKDKVKGIDSKYIDKLFKIGDRELIVFDFANIF